MSEYSKKVKIALSVIVLLGPIIFCASRGGKPTSDSNSTTGSISSGSATVSSKSAFFSRRSPLDTSKTRKPLNGRPQVSSSAAKLADDVRKCIAAVSKSKIGNLQEHLRGIYIGTSIDKPLLQDVATLLTDEEIDRLLILGLNFTAEDVARIKDRDSFVANLCSLLTEEKVPSETEVKQETGLRMTHSLREDAPEKSVGMSQFTAQTKKIYTVFKTSLEMRSGVLFRCYNTITGDIINITKQSIEINSEYTFIWLLKPEDWNPGNYKISLYMVDSLRELQTGNFSILDEKARAYP